MKYLRAQLVRVLTQYFGDDDRRIEHALRVLFHAETIMGHREDCDPPAGRSEPGEGCGGFAIDAARHAIVPLREGAPRHADFGTHAF